MFLASGDRCGVVFLGQLPYTWSVAPDIRKLFECGSKVIVACAPHQQVSLT
jgi:hypothetical protein